MRERTERMKRADWRRDEEGKKKRAGGKRKKKTEKFGVRGEEGNKRKE